MTAKTSRLVTENSIFGCMHVCMYTCMICMSMFLFPMKDDLQKLTDDYIKKLEALLKTKEKDLLKI